ncbi:hypothetical protein THAOC_00249, partial [Thalassiosira oceanica]
GSGSRSCRATPNFRAKRVKPPDEASSGPAPDAAPAAIERDGGRRGGGGSVSSSAFGSLCSLASSDARGIRARRADAEAILKPANAIQPKERRTDEYEWRSCGRILHGDKTKRGGDSLDSLGSLPSKMSAPACANCGKEPDNAVKLKNCAFSSNTAAGCILAFTLKSKKLDCPFCRAPTSTDKELARVQARVDAKDPAAITLFGDFYFFEKYGLERDVQQTIRLWREAADLGSSEAQMKLGNFYYNGVGVTQDEAKARHYWGKAACQGHMEARHNLGAIESACGNFERAVRHWMIPAKLGCKQSLDNIKAMFAAGHATKQQYGEALVGYQASTEDMKSPEREKASLRKSSQINKLRVTGMPQKS